MPPKKNAADAPMVERNLPVTPVGQNFTPERSGVMSTPRTVRTDVGDVATDEVRKVVAQNMNTEMLECNMGVFLRHYGASKVPDGFVAGCREHLKQRRYLLPDGTWKHFPTPPSIVKESENNCFEPLELIVEEMFNYATSTGERGNNYVFKMVPNTRLSSDVAGSNHMMDACIVEKELDKGPYPNHLIIMPVEGKKGNRSDDTKVVREQIVGDCHHIFADDPRRMFVYAITIVSTRMTAWYFSRSHSVKSMSFDWMHGEGLDEFIELMLSFALSTPEGLGIDPSVHKAPSLANEGQQYVYEVEMPRAEGPVQPSSQLSPKGAQAVLRSGARNEKKALAGEGKEMLYFRTLRIISRERPLIITGRMTRIWVVRQVESRNSFRFIPGSKEVILKDVWIDSQDSSETENVKQIFLAVDRYVEEGLKRFPGPDGLEKLINQDPRFRSFNASTKKRLRSLLTNKEYRKMFLTTLYEWTGKETKSLPLPNDDGIPQVRTPRDDVFITALKLGSIASNNRDVTQQGSANPSLPTHGEKHSKGVLQRGYVNKTQRRFVYKEVCTPSYKLKKFGDAAGIIRQALDALQILYCAGWVHRDISVGNLLAMETTDPNGGKHFLLKLSDFEFAQRAGTTRHRSDPRTGTPFFMPAEIMRGRYLFPFFRISQTKDITQDTSQSLDQTFVSTINSLWAQREEEDDEEDDDPLSWDIGVDHPLYKRLQDYRPTKQLLPVPKTNISTDLPGESAVVVYNYQHDLESIWWIILYFVTMLADHEPSETYARKNMSWFRYDDNSVARAWTICAVLDKPELASHLKGELALIFPRTLEKMRSHLCNEYIKRELYGLLNDDASYSNIHGKFAHLFDFIIDSIPVGGWAQLKVQSSTPVVPAGVSTNTGGKRRAEGDEAHGNSKKHKP